MEPANHTRRHIYKLKTKSNLYQIGLIIEKMPNKFLLHISLQQGWLDTGSSSNGGGTCPYIISQLMSSKSNNVTKQEHVMFDTA